MATLMNLSVPPSSFRHGTLPVLKAASFSCVPRVHCFLTAHHTKHALNTMVVRESFRMSFCGQTVRGHSASWIPTCSVACTNHSTLMLASLTKQQSSIMLRSRKNLFHMMGQCVNATVSEIDQEQNDPTRVQSGLWQTRGLRLMTQVHCDEREKSVAVHA